jgi:hypothetical protein
MIEPEITLQENHRQEMRSFQRPVTGVLYLSAMLCS